MTKLKIGSLSDERPVKVSVELPASVHRDLLAYAKAVASESGQPISEVSLSRRCWRDSWPQIGGLQNGVV
jgi:hypothetical protein